LAKIVEKAKAGDASARIDLQVIDLLAPALMG